MNSNELLEMIFAEMPRDVFADNPTEAIAFGKMMANYLYKENGDMPGAVLFAVRFVVEVGLPFESSFDALFGAGQFKKLAFDMYNRLRAQAAAA
jgi:hypothetical protein